jgi:hypothetical protein
VHQGDGVRSGNKSVYRFATLDGDVNQNDGHEIQIGGKSLVKQRQRALGVGQIRFCLRKVKLTHLASVVAGADQLKSLALSLNVGFDINYALLKSTNINIGCSYFTEQSDKDVAVSLFSDANASLCCFDLPTNPYRRSRAAFDKFRAPIGKFELL